RTFVFVMIKHAVVDNAKSDIHMATFIAKLKRDLCFIDEANLIHANNPPSTGSAALPLSVIGSPDSQSASLMPCWLWNWSRLSKSIRGCSVLDWPKCICRERVVS